MTELVLFTAVLAAMCVYDYLKTRKSGMKRELVPYMLFTAAALIAAVIAFTGREGASILSVVLRAV